MHAQEIINLIHDNGDDLKIFMAIHVSGTYPNTLIALADNQSVAQELSENFDGEAEIDAVFFEELLHLHIG